MSGPLLECACAQARLHQDTRLLWVSSLVSEVLEMDFPQADLVKVALE